MASQTAVYYFPSMQFKISTSNLVNNKVVIDYPTKTDVAVRKSHTYYYGTDIQFVADASSNKYMVVHTKNKDGNLHYYLALSLKSDNNSKHELNGILSSTLSATPVNNSLNINPLLLQVTPVTRSSDTAIVSIYDTKIPITSANLTKVSGTDPQIPFTRTELEGFTLTQGEPKIEMTCNHKGDDMSKLAVTKTTMNDKDIMEMITVNTIMFIAIIGGYAMSFPYLYKTLVIDVMGKYSESNDKPAVGYVTFFWSIVLLIYAFSAVIYGLRANNGSLTIAGVFIFIAFSVSSYLKGLQPNQDTSPLKDKLTMHYFAFGFTGIFAILTLVSSFGVMGGEAGFIGISTTFLLVSTLIYGVFAAMTLAKA